MKNEADSSSVSLTVYHSGSCGNARNRTYPYVGTGSTPEELKQLFRYDHIRNTYLIPKTHVIDYLLSTHYEKYRRRLKAHI